MAGARAVVAMVALALLSASAAGSPATGMGARPDDAGERAQPAAGELAEDAAALFDEAVKGWRSDRAAAVADLERSISRYEQLAASGVRTPGLHANLGSAYLLRGEVGPAVLHLRRAASLDPGDPAVRAMLGQARQRVTGTVPSSVGLRAAEVVRWWSGLVDRWVWVALLVASNAAVWTVLGARWLAGRRVPVVGAIGLAGLVVGGVALAGDAWIDHLDSRAVVVMVETDSWTGADESVYAKAFDAPLPAGLECRVVERDGSWLHLRLPNGSTAWIPNNRATGLWE